MSNYYESNIRGGKTIPILTKFDNTSASKNPTATNILTYKPTRSTINPAITTNIENAKCRSIKLF
ncbi:16178_t:CDS:2 [Dentiscutata erythropus]|uniref:16178_t:CDS:1 n=1 Tax=Dentiscutata erythropus TaxID=1348616 RepID=A0A9N9DUW1_9GLOM|nr:16178_t:CDS:2 [Dentiscutata erythropus]